LCHLAVECSYIYFRFFLEINSKNTGDKLLRMIFINSTSTVRIHQRTNHSSIDGGKGAWIDFDNDPVRLTFISQVGYVQVIQCTKLTLITKYWLVSGTDSSVILLKYRQTKTKAKLKLYIHVNTYVFAYINSKIRCLYLYVVRLQMGSNAIGNLYNFC